MIFALSMVVTTGLFVFNLILVTFLLNFQRKQTINYADKTYVAVIDIHTDLGIGDVG